MELSEETVRHVARLARLALTEAEVSDFRRELSQVLQYVEQLNAVDTSAVEPTMHVLAIENAWRADVVQPSLPLEAALQNAPAAHEGMFRVPRIVDDETPDSQP